MREIKFRGNDGCDWIYSEIVMYDTDYLNGEEKEIGFMCIGEVEDWDNGWRSVCYVGEYTGLKDKNDKEIYEGDIVHLFGKGYHEGVDYNGCVQFLDGGFCVTDGYKEWGLRRYDLTRCDLEIEIIGNIYEDSELLSDDSNDKCSICVHRDDNYLDGDCYACLKGIRDGYEQTKC